MVWRPRPSAKTALGINDNAPADEKASAFALVANDLGSGAWLQQKEKNDYAIHDDCQGNQEF